MNKTTQVESSEQLIPNSITEFEVGEGGILKMAHCFVPKIREDFYYIFDCLRSPADLIQSIDDCQPLAWETQSIYSDYRDDLINEIDDAENEEEPDYQKINELKTRLDSMPEEPEDGVRNWLLNLVEADYFKTIISERVKVWLSEAPDWSFEEDYFDESPTAVDAAYKFFQDMDRDLLHALGIVVIEGLYPGSTYYAAELHSGIAEANAAAEAAEIPVRFVKSEEVVDKSTSVKSEDIENKSTEQKTLFQEIVDQRNKRLRDSGFTVKEMGPSRTGKHRFQFPPTRTRSQKK
jgi:hypothetical protein